LSRGREIAWDGRIEGEGKEETSRNEPQVPKEQVVEAIDRGGGPRNRISPKGE